MMYAHPQHSKCSRHRLLRNRTLIHVSVTFKLDLSYCAMPNETDKDQMLK